MYEWSIEDFRSENVPNDGEKFEFPKVKVTTRSLQ